VRRILVFAVVAFGLWGWPFAAIPDISARAAENAEDEYQGLPAGEGRDEVFGLCGACHSLKLVVQQGLSRSRWSDTLDYMTEEQEMPELEPEQRKLILDYLARFYGPDRKARSLAK